MLKFLFTNISLNNYSNFSLCSYISRNINVPWDQAPLSLQLQVTRLSLSLVYLCPSVLFSPFSLPHTGIQVQHLQMQNNTNRSEHCVLVRSKEDIEQGCTNPGWQVTVATTFCMVMPNICSERLHVTFLVPRILRWILRFLENLCTPALEDVHSAGFIPLHSHGHKTESY